MEITSEQGGKMAKIKHKLKTPEWLLDGNSHNDNCDEKQIEFIKEQMFEEIPDLSDVKVKPEFMREMLFGTIRMHTTWKELETIANFYCLDISSFKKCEEKAEAISFMRMKVKGMDI